MELTGECAKAFERWYRNPLGTDEPRWTNWNGTDLYSIETFHRLDESMQYGVYVDFFDSVGIECIAYKRRESYSFEAGLHFDKNTTIGYRDTLHEARTAAIDKANEIFNNQNK